MLSLPVDFTNSPSEIVGYDNICMYPGDCGQTPPPVINGCLKDSKVAVTCNPDGTYTLTLSGSSFTGTVITMTSQTPGVTVTPPQQPWAATTTWTITGATPGQTVILTANATKVGGGGAPGSDECCSGEIKIVMPDCPKPQTGEVVVEKKVKNDTRASASVINTLIFPIGLSCTAPSNLSVSFGLNNGGTHTENNVPYTSVCTVTESVSTLPPVPKDVCGEGSAAVWLTPVITPSSATISAPVTAFTVVNELKCVPVGSLSVTKIVFPDPRGIGSTLIFPMTVTCTNPPASYPLNVHGNTSTVPINVPVGSICSIAETQTPLPLGCTWQAPVYSSATVTIANGLNTATVTNSYTCRGGPQICPPQQVSNVDGICVCPPPMVTGAAPGTCICPQGTTLVNGKCVPVDSCQPPLIMIPGAGCKCPHGEVLVGKECVKKIVCDPPLVPSADGTACVRKQPQKPKREKTCKRGYFWNGDMCVKRKTEPKEANPRERPGIRIPGGFPGLGGGSSGGGQGGSPVGATPGKR
jgi:hypothetical protein